MLKNYLITSLTSCENLKLIKPGVLNPDLALLFNPLCDPHLMGFTPGPEALPFLLSHVFCPRLDGLLLLVLIAPFVASSLLLELPHLVPLQGIIFDR